MSYRADDIKNEQKNDKENNNETCMSPIACLTYQHWWAESFHKISCHSKITTGKIKFSLYKSNASQGITEQTK